MPKGRVSNQKSPRRKGKPKARNYDHRKMPISNKNAIKALKRQAEQIRELDAQGKVDPQKFDVAQELKDIGARIKGIFRSHRHQSR